MPIKTKINLKLFFLSTFIANAIVCYFASSTKELVVFLSIYLASLINFYMLYIGGLEIKRAATSKNGEKADKLKIIYMFLGKIVVLLLALIFGVLFVGNKIIIPLLNYVIHIFILALSLRNKEN